MQEVKNKKRTICLRHVTLDDAEAFFKCHDKEATKNFYSVPKSLDDAKKEIQEKIAQYKLPTNKRQEEFFVIEKDDQIAGWISLHDIRYKHKAVTGSLVCPQFRGQGIGTKAHKLLLKHAFQTYKLVRVIGRVRTFNKASARMLEKSGYNLEGVMKKDHFQNGKYYDNYLYAKTR